MKTENYIGNSSKTGVYAIINDVNGKAYIGSSGYNFHSRKARHLKGLRGGNHFNPHLQSDFNLFGTQNFTFKILFLCDKSVCKKYEQWYIEKFKSSDRRFGYNLYPAMPGLLKYKRRPEVVNMISARKKIKAKSLNGLLSSERGINKPIKMYSTDGVFEKRFDSGKHLGLELGFSIPAISRTLSNRKLYLKNKIIIFDNDNLTIDDIKLVQDHYKRRHVFLYSTSGEFIMEYDSVSSCAAFLGCKDSEVRMCNSGRRSRIKQYITRWEKI